MRISQNERTKAGTSSFKNGLLGLANRTDGLLAATSYTRDSDGNLVGQRFTLQSSNYYLFDGLGSVVALTDSAGAVVNRYVYDPYGNPATGTTETVANPWQWLLGPMLFIVPGLEPERQYALRVTDYKRPQVLLRGARLARILAGTILSTLGALLLIAAIFKV